MITGTTIVMEVDCVNDIQRFIMDHFWVVKYWYLWMYDPLGVFVNTLQRNKKTPSFKYHLHPHIECYLNQMEKEVEETPE